MITTIKSKQYHLLSLLLLAVTLLFSNVSFAFANDNSTSDPHIFDEAALLSTTEKESLEEESITYGIEAGIDMIVLTHDNSSAKNDEEYIEDFFDQNNYTDCVILLIDMANRSVMIEGYGTAETYIHSKRGDVIIKEITPDLTSGNYVNAIETFYKESNAYMKDDSELNTDHNYGNSSYTNNSDSSSANSIDTILKSVWFQLLASIIIGGIVVGVMVSNSGGRMTTGGNNYIDAGDSGLIGQRDNYIRTTVTRVKKPEVNNTNSGGFSGGSSGGGSSHSTSSGSF